MKWPHTHTRTVSTWTGGDLERDGENLNETFLRNKWKRLNLSDRLS